MTPNLIVQETVPHLKLPKGICLGHFLYSTKVVRETFFSLLKEEEGDSGLFQYSWVKHFVVYRWAFMLSRVYTWLKCRNAMNWQKRKVSTFRVHAGFYSSRNSVPLYRPPNKVAKWYGRMNKESVSKYGEDDSSGTTRGKLHQALHRPHRSIYSSEPPHPPHLVV